MSTEQHKFEGRGPEKYERDGVTRVFGPLAHQFLEYIPLDEGDRVLDVACGTGAVARLAAQKVGSSGSVSGVDINPGMLDVARRNEPDNGAPLEWHEGDATELPFEDSSFDVVLCQQGLQFIPDKKAALREMYRVLVPGGSLGICVWRSIEHSPSSLAKAEAIGRHVSPEAGEKARRRTPFSFPDPELLKEVVIDAGFQDVDVRAVDLQVNQGSAEEATNRESFPELDHDTAMAVVEDIREAIRPLSTENGIITPYSYNLSLAKK
jgi:ubiquinone/menaquinone biosynthesis C-methylase UbiE